MGVRWRAYVPAGRQVRSEAPPWPSFVLYFVLMGELGIQHGLWDPVPLQLRHRNSKMSLVLQYPMQYCSSSAVICGCHIVQVLLVLQFFFGNSFWYCN